MAENENESKLHPVQQARAEALTVAGNVLSNTRNLFGGKTPVPASGVDDLLKVASWIFGDLEDDLGTVGVLEVPPSMVPSLFEKIAGMVPDCGHDDCAIHAPARAAKDVTPEDIVPAPPTSDEPIPPLISTINHPVGYTFAKDGIMWQVVHSGLTKVWANMGAVADNVEDVDDLEPDTDEEDTRPIPVGNWVTDEVPWEAHGSNPDREIDERDLSGGAADAANEADDKNPKF